MINPNWIILQSQIVHKILREKNKKLVLVESCTGGNVAGSLVVNCPGISKYLHGSHVVYCLEAKCNWLGVPKDYLEKYTCESEECANELAIMAGKKDKMDAIAVVGHLNTNEQNGSTIFVSHANESGLCECKHIKLHSKDRHNAMNEAVISTLMYTAAVL